VLQPGQSLEGYRILRQIGAGGFGEIWLCEKEAAGELRALKFIPAGHDGRLDKEYHALGLYRNAAGRLRSPALMPIEHASLLPDGLLYIMPLADGLTEVPPSSPEWRPKTLSAVVAQQKTESAWFSRRQLVDWIDPILTGLQLLSEAGLVHRDVKPDNILFLNGSPCLSDISLLGEDAQQLTRRGTPGFSAPTWFVESGGHPDMYGAATTFYTMLTGNAPDKMGRAAFRWPPQGEASFSPGEKTEWLRFHQVIRRAIDDRPAERFIDFTTFARRLHQGEEEAGSDPDDTEATDAASPLGPPFGFEKDATGRRRLTRRAALLSLPLLTIGGYLANETLSGDKASPGSPKTSFALGSEIPWVTASIVVDSLKNCGFKQIADEPGLLVFNKKMKEDNLPQGVTVALHYDAATKAVWTYRCLRISNNETLKFDNQAFEEGVGSICGIFVADKEWSEIHKFIYKPKNAMREVRFKEETMLFRGAHLTADCELVFEADDSSTLQHAFAVSSRE
jgi:serine/threonine protein kinase